MKRSAFCLLLLSAISPAFAQVADHLPLQLKKQLETNSKQQPEKIYLHTDRSFYASGDTVWYKAYLLEPQTLKPHPVSEILYLDLISENKQRVLSQRLKTESGSKAASLILPDTLKTGNYLLQVYTNFQRNAGPQTFFRQPLWVNKVPELAGKTVGKTPEKVAQVIFYPEGGKLLAGFENKVGFKAVAANGENVTAAGQVVDETGEIITTFRSNNSGLGSFKLKPKLGKTYRAQVLTGSERKEFPLEVTEKGYALNVKNAPDSVAVLLASANKINAPVYLVLQSRGNLLAADSVMFNANGLRNRCFEARNWPEGIVQVSLLNEAKTPENERLFFHRKAKPLQVKLETAKAIYGRREPVSVNITLQDETGKPLEAVFSVAVTSNVPATLPAMRQHVLLASEVKEMQSFSPDQPTDIDELLLTQNLREFAWQAAANSETNAPAFSRETELNQPGFVSENGAPVNNAVIYLLETNSGKTYLLTSDAEGKFRIPAEGNSFFYQIWQNGIWHKNARLELTESDEVLPMQNWNVTAATDSVQTKRFTLRRQIDQVYARENLKPKAKLVNKEMCPAYPAKHYYPLEQYNQLTNMEEILREMVPSVRVVTRKKMVQANVYNDDTRTFFPNQPLYIIDGQPTWNNDLFLRLDGSQLEQVNIYNSAKTLQPFGFLGNNGVIVVFTKSHNYQNPELSTQNMLKVPGQYSSSQFNLKDRPASIPDFRPTLYWNPELKTNAEGKADFTFKTSDAMGNLRVQVEGITKDGQLISEELLIPVQPAE